MDNDRDNRADETPIPAKLAAAFRRPQARRVFVPPTVDEAVLRAARNHFAPGRQSRRGELWFWLRWPAVAVACVLLFALIYRASQPGSPTVSTPVYAREDLNRDGRVDILDAFLFARQLESGFTTATIADLNYDGVIDRRDAEVIAAQAVKLEKGGRS
jgi:hypothetical protein